MKTNKIKLEFCDFCKVTEKNAQIKIGKQKCTICGKYSCLTEDCEGYIKDDYGTTNHLPFNNYANRSTFPFICGECWTKAMAVDSDKIKRGVDMRASGSTWAIRLGEYATMHYYKAVQQAIDKTVTEVKRLIKVSEKHDSNEKEKTKLRQKIEVLQREAGDD